MIRQEYDIIHALAGALVVATEQLQTPPKAVEGTSPAAKTARLSPEAESMLLTMFAIQDMLGREDAFVLAQQVSCSRDSPH